ncbi:MAG: efflux RND transporter periplasmic adaptor subunit [Polyangiales bacterium]
MKNTHLPRSLRLALTVALGILGACARSVPRTARGEFPAPYQIDTASPPHLRVRADLDRLLETQTVSPSGVRASLVGYGRMGFAPNASYAVRVPYPSFVERVRVDVGDGVTRGQPLVDLRSSEVARLRAEAANGQVSVNAERQTLARLARLVADGTATERELAESRSRLQSALAQLAGVRSALQAAGINGGEGDRYTLRAAVEGRVLIRHVDPGERVSPDDAQPAFLVGDPQRLVVRAAFPERDAVWLAEGLPCVFTVSALGEDRFEGSISHLVRAVDPRTRSADATCAPTRQDPRLTSEMVARVEVRVSGGRQVVVPRSAVLLRRDEPVVFVRVSPGVLERRSIEPGLSMGDQMQIARGLHAGERVVTRGAVLLDGELDQLL